MLNTRIRGMFSGVKSKKEVLPDRQTIRETVLRYGICTVVGFLFTRMTLLGFLNGFGFSFAAALPLPFSVGGLIGCLIGEVLDGLDAETFFYIGTLVIWYAVKKWIFATALPKHFMGVFWQSAVLGAVLLLKTAATYFISDLSLMEFVLQLLSIVLQLLVFISTMVFDTAFLMGKSLMEYTRVQGLSAIVLGVLVIASAGRYALSGFGLAGIISVIAVTVSVYRFGCIGGAVSGILAGMGLLLYDASMIEFAGIMMFGGFLAGLVAQRSKLTAAVSVMVVHYILVLIYGKPLQMMPLTVCTMIGVMAFLCIPADFLEGIALPRVFFANGPPEESDDLLGQLEDRLQIRMEFVADTVSMLGASVVELADILKKEVRPDAEQVYAAVENKLCRSCKRRFQCYGADYDRIRDSFNDLNSVLHKSLRIGTESFPQFLKENCIRPNDLIRIFTSVYQQLSFLSAQQRQLNRSRSLVLEQYSAMSELLKQLGEGEHLSPDPEKERLLSEYLSKEGYAPEKIKCGTDQKDRLFMDLYYSQKQPPAGELKELTEKCLGIILDKPVVSDGRNMTRISFYEPPPYGVNLSVTQKAAGERKGGVNGDTVVSFHDGKGNFYLLLSDGMGKGKRAALDSMTVCTILSKLITSGFGWQAAVRLLNTSLTVKSTEESLATVDIIRVDLYTGQAEFIKAGAASSYWASEKSVSRVRSFTLPIGIVSGISFDSKIVAAEAGDILLLVSDGIGEDEGWIAKKIFQGRGKPLQQLTDSICEEAAVRCGKERDDMTAAAISLIRYRNEEDDIKN